MADTLLRYQLLDRLLGAGVVPDWALRAGSRAGIARVERRERAGGVAAAQGRLTALIARKSSGPIALATETANEQHYALPAEFFGLFLGARRKYSGCLLPGPDSTLDEAEEAMLELSCERAGIEDGQDVLDLGCGWGAISLWIAERYPGCRVTGVSNSAPQRLWIEAEAERRGVADRVRIITADVNDLELEPASFDRVVSVEMLEHLNNWKEMLRRVSTWVRPEGRVFIHVFTPPPHRRLSLRGDVGRRALFFTAGVMPSHDLLLHFQDDLAVRERWIVDGTHYSRTLAAWLERLDANRDAALEILGHVYRDDRQARIALRQLAPVPDLLHRDLGPPPGKLELLVSHYLLEPRG